MISLARVDVCCVHLLCTTLLLAVGHHTDAAATAGELLRIKLGRNTGSAAAAAAGLLEACGQDAQCVSGYEYCAVDSAKLQKCGLDHQLSQSLCCPSDKVVQPKREKRTIIDDEESDLDKVLDRAAPEPIKPLPEEPDCGLNTKSISNITAVQNSKASDWPWMAVFLETTNYENFCGGIILNRRFILTAAHCFKRYTKQKFVVRLGEYDFTTTNDTNYIDYKASDIRQHPDYDPATHANDIALVKLNRLTVYNSFIRPICLPKTNLDVYKRSSVVTGWGQTVFGGQLSTVLQEVAVPIWEHDQCVSAFSQPIFKTNLCAASYEGGKDSCLGDSGGPLLVQRQDGRWTNVGIVSWGISCGEPGLPGVYTKVTSYLKWIAVTAQDIM